MFTFRRKNNKKQTNNGPPFIRASPSLPDLSAHSIQWPESLVDVTELPAIKAQPAVPRTVKKSVSGKPKGSISAIYTSHPPSSFDNRKSTYSSRRKPSQKNRNPLTFNIMVAGAQGTGKTSLLRLLTETSDISPTSTNEQRASLYAFLQGTPRHTSTIQPVTVEICESKFDRMTLSVIDTPGLDFSSGHELTLERQVASIVEYLDAQFAETLSEESKIVRESKGDKHVHLCIYTIDPSSIMSSSERQSLPPLPLKQWSERRVSYQPSDNSSSNVHSPMSGEGSVEASDDLTMSPADIAVMKRLAKKTNLLPVVARADSLTDTMLAAVKRVVRRDLLAAGLDFGVFAPAASTDVPSSAPGNATPQPQDHNGSNAQQDNDEDDEQEERRTRPVIKIKSARNIFKFRTSSRSRSRLDLAETGDEPSTADALDTESVANVRFSASTVAKTDLAGLLPFALIAPEHKTGSDARLASPISRMMSVDHESVDTHGEASVASPTDDGHGPASIISSPTSGHTKNFPFLDAPPSDLRGVFTRSYRWGTIDVLAPEHCDFAAMRTAVLSTHMKMLKIRTKEVLYERYRTEKLLARRATRNISEAEQRRMFAEIGL